ncbi:MAG: M28 family metallopeptidase [Lysinibacillus sp.]
MKKRITFMGRRIFTVILCPALAIGVLSGCGKQETAEKITLSNKDEVLQLEHNYAGQAAKYLEIIASDFNGLNAKGKLRDWMIDELKSAGYSDEQIVLQKIKGSGLSSGKNIILTVPGQQADKQIIVGAHYDGDGAGDNGSGVALLLAEAVGLVGEIPAYTVKYVFFDEEESRDLGSEAYVESMSEKEKANTMFMVNIDSIAFGDYACIYGGKQDDAAQEVTQTEGYELAMKYADELGFSTYGTEELDGYFEVNGTGPELDPLGVFTNPWTYDNPAPMNMKAASPATMPTSDHAPFSDVDIPYIYFEATNWFATGESMDDSAYTGYYETYDTTIGWEGIFMNTKYDTLENLETYFPGRAMEHFNIYSPILSKLIIEPK